MLACISFIYSLPKLRDSTTFLEEDWGIADQIITILTFGPLIHVGLFNYKTFDLLLGFHLNLLSDVMS